jgi:hypothetical protein
MVERSEVPGELLSCEGAAEGPGALTEEMDHLEKKLYAKYSKGPPHIGHTTAVNAPVQETGSRAGGAGEALLVENNPSVGVVRVCITCGGVGKRYENMLMGDLRGEGAMRVIESSCSGCKGTGVIERVAEVRPRSSPFSYHRLARWDSNLPPPSSTLLLPFPLNGLLLPFPLNGPRNVCAHPIVSAGLPAETCAGGRRARGGTRVGRAASRAGGRDWEGGAGTPRRRSNRRAIRAQPVRVGSTVGPAPGGHTHSLCRTYEVPVVATSRCVRTRALPAETRERIGRWIRGRGLREGGWLEIAG